MRLNSPLQPMVSVVYEPKTPDQYSGESGGIRTLTPQRMNGRVVYATGLQNQNAEGRFP
jgi:hypothetical protein